jgi:hypothetical protein
MMLSKLIQQQLREGLIFEEVKKMYLTEGIKGVALPVTKTVNKPDELIEYSFNLTNDHRYEICLTPTTKGGRVGTYELIYKNDIQQDSSDVVGTGVKGATEHIVATCVEVMNREAKENKIRVFRWDGVPDEKDYKKNRLDNTRRSVIYNHLLNNSYPAGVVTKENSVVYVDMTKAFPELFEDDNGGSTVNTLLKVLMQVSNKHGDKNVIIKGFEGNENTFTVSTDELENASYGGLDLDILVNNLTNQYEVEYNKFDIGEAQHQRFETFGDLLKYIQTNLLK